MKKEKLITAQSSSFIEQGLEHMVRAKKVYDKNKTRQPIAELENFNASEAIIDFLIFLESHFNRIGYFKSEKDTSFKYYGVNDLLETKMTKILSKCPSNLKETMEDVKQIRNAIIHAHIWIEERSYTEDYKLIESIFRRSAIFAEFRQRFEDLVDFQTLRTKKCSFNIIPTKVDFIDALQTLMLTEKIVDNLQEEYGKLHVMSYMAPLHPLDKVSKEYAESLSFRFHYGSLQEWIALFSKVIHETNKRQIEDFRKFIVRESETVIERGQNF